MNNEEKILSMLTQMKSDMSDMKATQAEQGDRLSRLETKVGKIEDMQEELRTAVNRVALKQEQDVIPYVKLLDEDHADIRQKLPEKSQVEALEKDMRLVKTSVKTTRNGFPRWKRQTKRKKSRPVLAHWTGFGVLKFCYNLSTPILSHLAIWSAPTCADSTKKTLVGRNKDLSGATPVFNWMR